MSTFSINKADKLPEISRAGRRSEELNMIIETLKMSANGNTVFNITGIKAGNAYNSMQQRIRAQAKKLNLGIVIRFDSKNETLYFQASNTVKVKNTDKDISVKASDVPGVKSRVKTK